MCWVLAWKDENLFKCLLRPGTQICFSIKTCYSYSSRTLSLAAASTELAWTLFNLIESDILCKVSDLIVKCHKLAMKHT